MVPAWFILIAFLCGSLPFSAWLGKIFLGLDVRHCGDGNPGAANTFRAGNKLVGLLALILDISIAAVPVGLAYFNLGIRGGPGKCCHNGWGQYAAGSDQCDPAAVDPSSGDRGHFHVPGSLE